MNSVAISLAARHCQAFFKSVGVGRRIIYFLLASSLISMLLALCDYRSLDRSVVVLNKAHLDVSRLLIWWNALSVAEKNSKANANRLVSVTENAAVAEAQILLGGHGGLGLLDDGAYERFRMIILAGLRFLHRRRCAADASAKELAASTADAARMLDRIRVRLASQKALLAELRDPAHPSGMKSFD